MSKGELRWYGAMLPTTLNRVRLVVLSDIHYGNPLCSMRHVKRTLDFIGNNGDVYCVLNGDLIEAVTKLSKGDIHSQELTPQQQCKDVLRMLQTIQPKILGMTTGNHEQRIYNEVGHDYSLDIAETLNVPYRPEGILLKITFGDSNNRTKGRPYAYWGYCTHGYGGARTKSAKAVKAERLSTWIHADFYCMSHDHVVNISPDVYLIPDNRGEVDNKTGFFTGQITAKRKMLIKTGAFLKWGGYSEAGGFPPVDLETPIITLAGEGKPRVRVEV